MKPTAIVYTFNTGFTAQYARLLAEETGLPVYPPKEASRALPGGSSVLYLGWLMAGKVQGYDKAAKLFAIPALCGVGMGANGSQDADIRKANRIADSVPVFTLQGGFDRSKLRGVYKLMMTVMAKTVGKQLARKPDRTPEETDMLELLQSGGSRVCRKNLDGVLTWYREAAK